MSENAPNRPSAIAPRELAAESIHEYRETAHVLIPEQRLAQVSPFFKISVNAVRLSPNPDDRDIWKLPGGKYALSKQGLYKIASAAGISFGVSEVVKVERDYVCVKASVMKRNSSGEWETRTGTAEIDLDVVQEDLYMANVDKMQKNYQYAPKNDDECVAKARAEAMKIRRHKVARCETGAYLRAIRAMLPLKGEYSQDDFKKPFIVAACHYAPDYSDPMVLQLVKDGTALGVARLCGTEATVEAETGKTRVQLEESRQVLHAITERHIPNGVEEQDGPAAAMRDATPIDHSFPDDEEGWR